MADNSLAKAEKHLQAQCIHQMFEAQVKETPTAVAIIFNNQSLTYQELNQRANQLAHYLLKHKVGLETLVGICVERSLEMVIGLIGILKAGGAYVPLDPTYPKERLDFMINDSNVPIVLTQHKFLDLLPLISSKIICLDTEVESIAQCINTNPVSDCTFTNASYVIYTSGSTGVPKGVVGEHCAIMNRFAWMWEQYPFQSTDICCQKTPLSFVDSIWEIFGPLLKGVSLIILPDDSVKNLQLLVHSLKTSCVTRIVLVPSLLRAILDTYEDLAVQLPHLNFWVSSGEVLPIDLAQRFIKVMPQALLLNLYGSSEVAGDVTYYDTRSLSNNMHSVPIGRPITNTQIYILDSHLQPVPMGTPGELWIGGLNLAREYLNQPRLTAERFLPNPFDVAEDSRIYKMGDFAVLLPDENLEYLGRIDHQVKIRGFRVELGEIETVLRQYPGVRDVAVVTNKDNSENSRLVAYIVVQPDTNLTMIELRSFIVDRLPNYMVPAFFVSLECLPLTPSGKVDRRLLSVTDWTRSNIETENTFIAPYTSIEKIMASIWEEVLGLDRVGIHDDFFELGGHSLMAMRVVVTASKKNIFITLQQFLRHRTISELAKVVGSAAITTDQSTIVDKAPCLPQHLDVFDMLSESQYENYIIYTLVETKLKFNRSTLEKVIKSLSIHHDALRTRFVRSDIGWQQYFVEVEEAPIFSWFDLSEHSEVEQDSEIETIALNLKSKMRISEGPLIQVAVFDLGMQRLQRLLILISHFVADEVSLGILMEDIEAAYLQLEQEEVIGFPLKTTSVAYYAERLNQYAKTIESIRALDSWLNVDFSKIRRSVKYISDSTKLAVLQTTVKEEDTLYLFQKIAIIQAESILIVALAQTLKKRIGESLLLLRTVRHNRDSFFDDIDLSRTVGLIRLHEMLLLNFEQINSPQEALASIQTQLSQTLAPRENFYLGKHSIGNPLISEKLKQCYELTHAHLNLIIPAHKLYKPSLFAPVPRPNIMDAQTSPDVTLRIYATIESSGQLELSWYYYEMYYHQLEIDSLVKEFIDELKSIVALKNSQSL